MAEGNQFNAGDGALQIGEVAGNVVFENSVLRLAVEQLHINTKNSDPALSSLRGKLPPSCHADIHWLMHHEHFSAEDLLTAVKRKTLEGDSGKLKRSNAWMDQIAVATFMPTAFLIMVLSVPVALHTPGWYGLLAWSLVAASMLGGIGVLAIFHWPQRIAKRAVAALASRPMT